MEAKDEYVDHRLPKDEYAARRLVRAYLATIHTEARGEEEVVLAHVADDFPFMPAVSSGSFVESACSFQRIDASTVGIKYPVIFIPFDACVKATAGKVQVRTHINEQVLVFENAVGKFNSKENRVGAIVIKVLEGQLQSVDDCYL